MRTISSQRECLMRQDQEDRNAQCARTGLPEFHANLDMRAVYEVAGRHAARILNLNFDQAQRRPLAASNDQSIATFFDDLTRKKSELLDPFRRRFPNYQPL